MQTLYESAVTNSILQNCSKANRLKKISHLKGTRRVVIVFTIAWHKWNIIRYYHCFCNVREKQRKLSMLTFWLPASSRCVCSGLYIAAMDCPTLRRVCCSRWDNSCRRTRYSSASSQTRFETGSCNLIVKLKWYLWCYMKNWKYVTCLCIIPPVKTESVALFAVLAVGPSNLNLAKISLEM